MVWAKWDSLDRLRMDDLGRNLKSDHWKMLVTPKGTILEELATFALERY